MLIFVGSCAAEEWDCRKPYYSILICKKERKKKNKREIRGTYIYTAIGVRVRVIAIIALHKL